MKARTAAYVGKYMEIMDKVHRRGMYKVVNRKQYENLVLLPA